MEAPAATSPSIRFPIDGRCNYFVEKKKRFCRMVAAAGKRFCGEHAGSAEVSYRPPFLGVAGLWVLDPSLAPLTGSCFRPMDLSKCSSAHRSEPRGAPEEHCFLVLKAPSAVSETLTLILPSASPPSSGEVIIFIKECLKKITRFY